MKCVKIILKIAKDLDALIFSGTPFNRSRKLYLKLTLPIYGTMGTQIMALQMIDHHYTMVSRGPQLGPKKPRYASLSDSEDN